MPVLYDRSITTSRVILAAQRQGIDLLTLSVTQETLEGMYPDAFTRIIDYSVDHLIETYRTEYRVVYNTYLDNELIHSEIRIYKTNDPSTPTDKLAGYTIA